MTDVAAWLARKRVALGLIAAVAAVVLARPTRETWAIGLVIACVGEAVRIWAAGHLEKSREVTRSGPYRLLSHPLYFGSGLMALGIAVASNSAVVAALTAVYMATTITAAIRTEEAFLRRTFGDTYDLYQRSAAEPVSRRFSLERARRNREYRAVIGLVAGFALLALKVALPI